jgi:hypothetical protein
VFAATDVTAMGQAVYNLRAGETSHLPVVSLLVGNAPECADTFTRTITVLTPDTCSAPETSVVGNASFTLDGIAEGECTVELGLGGTSLRKTVTYRVQPPQ